MHISAVNNRNYRGGDFWILAPAFCTILQLSVFFFNVCFFAQWCDSIQQAWSLCEGPQPEASALSARGGDGSVSRCCFTCWISRKKNSNGKVALLLPSILISSCLKRPLPRLGSVNSPLTGWTAFPLTLTFASEWMALISCVTKYALQRSNVCLLTHSLIVTWDVFLFLTSGLLLWA